MSCLRSLRPACRPPRGGRPGLPCFRCLGPWIRPELVPLLPWSVLRAALLALPRAALRADCVVLGLGRGLCLLLVTICCRRRYPLWIAPSYCGAAVQALRPPLPPRAGGRRWRSGLRPVRVPLVQIGAPCQGGVGTLRHRALCPRPGRPGPTSAVLSSPRFPGECFLCAVPTCASACVPERCEHRPADRLRQGWRDPVPRCPHRHSWDLDSSLP